MSWKVTKLVHRDVGARSRGRRARLRAPTPVPSAELPRVLRALQATLKPGGVLFSSNPRGQGQEGWHGERVGAFHDLATWRRYMAAAGFAELEHYYRPVGLPREQQPWLASAWRAV